MDAKRELSKIIEDWIYDNCSHDDEYENLSATVPLLAELIAKRFEQGDANNKFEYCHTMPFTICSQCNRPFGMWKSANHTFTDEKLYEPGMRIIVKNG